MSTRDRLRLLLVAVLAVGICLTWRTRLLPLLPTVPSRVGVLLRQGDDIAMLRLAVATYPQSVQAHLRLADYLSAAADKIHTDWDGWTAEQAADNRRHDDYCKEAAGEYRQAERLRKSEARALAAAERLAALADGMPRADYADDGVPELGTAADEFQEVIDTFEPSGRAYTGIAQCKLQMSDYEGAADAVNKALECSPDYRPAKLGLENTARLSQVHRGVGSALPAGNAILQLRPYPRPTPGKSWIVLYGQSGACSDVPEVDCKHDLRLALVTGQKAEYRTVWQSGILRSTYWDADRRGLRDAAMYVEALKPGPAPDVLIQERYMGGSVEPSHLEVFSWRGGKLQNTLKLDSDWPSWIEDIRHNNHFQVCEVKEIDISMCHVCEPRWVNLYDRRGGRFRIADRQFPERYRGWIPKLRETLARYSDDYDILDHLGIAYAIAGRQRQAAAANKNAERFCRTYGLSRGELQYALQQIHAHSRGQGY